MYELQRILKKPLASGLQNPLMTHGAFFSLLIGNT